MYIHIDGARVGLWCALAFKWQRRCNVAMACVMSGKPRVEAKREGVLTATTPRIPATTLQLAVYSAEACNQHAAHLLHNARPIQQQSSCSSCTMGLHCGKCTITGCP